jgi:ubiquinol-cytochrome c reductase iron-sulfur subunit
MSHGTHEGQPELESTSHGELAVQTDPDRFPVPDPGLEEHLPRLTDVDEKAADRATRQVATLFGLVPVLAVGFVVVYFAVPSDWTIDFGMLHSNAQHVLLGLTLGLAVLLLGMGAIQWARTLMGDEEIVDIRHPMVSTDDARASVMEDVNKGLAETQLTRRKVIGRSLIGALVALGLPVIVGLADLGPWPTKKTRAETIERTIWAPGVRLVQDITFTPIKASDVVIGQLINGQPENLQDYEGTDFLVEKAKSSIIVVRMNPNTIKIPDSRRDWQVGGILCYSKICTHVGCPISLWEQQTHHLLCPCHQSTFDLGNSGVVVFGPAKRALPQLPITTDAEGYLVARSDFTVPVGPSFFERDSQNDFREGEN